MGGDLEELDLVLQYDPRKENWQRVGARLKKPRTSFVAIPLPDYLSCTNNFRPDATNRIKGGHHNKGYFFGSVQSVQHEQHPQPYRLEKNEVWKKYYGKNYNNFKFW